MFMGHQYFHLHHFINSGSHLKYVNGDYYSLLAGEEIKPQDFPGGPAAKTPCSQCRGPRFNPWSGNYIPHASTKNSHARTKDPTCRN